MDHATAQAFVDRWVRDWNAHDVDGMLTHYADDVVFTSPIAIQLFGGDGVLRGKAALRAYWSEGIKRIPDLHFTVNSFSVGVDTIVISYTNQRGGRVNEVLTFADDLVVLGHGTYVDSTPNPAGATG